VGEFWTDASVIMEKSDVDEDDTSKIQLGEFG
jgi:hypothetical protein